MDFKEIEIPSVISSQDSGYALMIEKHNVEKNDRGNPYVEFFLFSQGKIDYLTANDWNRFHSQSTHKVTESPETREAMQEIFK